MGKFFPTDWRVADFSVCAGHYRCNDQMDCKIMMQNKNIQVIETFRVSNNKFIQIIQVGKKYLVISVCKDVVNILTELAEEELVWKPSQEDTRGIKVNENFQDILSRLKDKIPRK